MCVINSIIYPFLEDILFVFVQVMFTVLSKFYISFGYIFPSNLPSLPF